MKILEDAQPAVESRLPRLVDMFLYPISAAGLIHIAVFVLLPRMVSFILGSLGLLLSPFLMQGTGYIITYLRIPFYALFISYVFYYIGYCIVDSAKGNLRAPAVLTGDTLDAGDCLSQVLTFAGCTAICSLPAAVYYIFTERTDSSFWLLSALAGFFLPMSLLTGVVFDSFDALNPLDILRSIWQTFLPYCRLLLFFYAAGGFLVFVLPRLHLWPIVAQAVRVYFVFVVAHRLGWFYWWNKDKLDWGI